MMRSIERMASRGGSTLAERVGLSAQEAKTIAVHGCELLESGNATDAATVFEALLFVNPRDSALWLGLGAAYEKLDRNAEAAQAYDHATRLGSPHAQQRRARLAQ